jgi:HEAT repeat protein
MAFSRKPISIRADHTGAAPLTSVRHALLLLAASLGCCHRAPPRTAVERHRAALRSGSGAERARAAQALGRLGSAAASAIPDLIEAMRDQDARFHAMIALPATGDAAIPALVEAMAEPELRPYAEQILRGLGQFALPGLIASLGSGSDGAAPYAADLLARLGSDAVPDLVAMIRVEKPRPHALRALSNIGLAGLSSLLVALVPEPRDVRKWAVAVATPYSLQIAHALPDLAPLFYSEEPALREVAILVFAFAGAASVPSLVRALEDPQLRGSAQRTLDLIGQPALPALRVALAAALPESRPLIEQVVRSIEQDVVPGSDQSR